MARTAVVREGQGEVIVETGTGLVQKLEGNPGGRNVRVEFKATHTNLADPVGGWLDTANEAGYALVQRAHVERFELEYRIEVHRLKGVDLERPIKALGNREKVRDLVAVGAPGTLGGPGPAATPAKPAAEAPAAPVAAPRQAPAPDTRQEPPAASEPAKVAGFPNPRANGATDPPAPPRSRVREAPPYEAANSDGTPNLGSFAVTAGAGMVDTAVELLVNAGLNLYPHTIELVAGDLMAAADAIQVDVCGGRPARIANSHTRARGLLRTAMRSRDYPLAAVVDEHGKAIDAPAAVAARDEWSAKVTRTGAELLRIAVRLAGVE